MEGASLALSQATPPVLVVTDVDGTLSTLVPVATEATLVPGAHELLVGLVTNHVPVAIVSGRGLDDLRQRFAWPAGVRLVGSHGLEDASRPAIVLTAEERQRLQAVQALAQRATKSAPGTWVETKVAGVAFHYRQARSASNGSVVAKKLEEHLARMEGIWLRRGHLVLEAAVRPASKAAAVEQLRQESGAATVVYLGDDDTDEEVFRVLGPPHVTVRVGPGETAAAHRVADPLEVVELLNPLADLSHSAC
jgi:trehalose 6-phosphate phosphatase